MQKCYVLPISVNKDVLKFAMQPEYDRDTAAGNAQKIQRSSDMWFLRYARVQTDVHTHTGLQTESETRISQHNTGLLHSPIGYAD